MGLLRNLSVRTKLLGSFIIVCTITAVVGTVGVMKLAQVNAKIDTMYNKELIGTAAVKDAALAVAAVGRDARQAILSNDPAEQQRIADGVSNYEKTIEEAMNAAESCFYTTEGKALVAKNLELLPPFIAKVRETNLLAIAGKKDDALKAVVESRAIAKVIIENLDTLADRKRDQAAEANEASKQLYANARIMMFLFIGGGVLLGLGLGYVIARAITVPLTQAVGVLQAIAAGDLTVRLNVNSRDEVGKMADSLNSAVGSMQEALSEVRGVADNVASASQQLASASQQISTGAQEQASSLEETASSLEEITATIRQNADNADQANQLSARSREVAEKGGKVVGDAVTGMQEINAASKRIADIITAIDEIAFQTNLLALNAAVEAARAGEQGRGFAVVAGEVRNLAQRSAGAAKEIKGLIQDSVRKVEVGTNLVNQSGETLAEIISSVKRVTDIVAEISAASREQATGIEQVNRAVAQMDQVTQENASQTEELSGTAEGLSGQAEGLQQLVRKFTLDSHHSHTGSTAAKPALSQLEAKLAKAIPGKSVKTFNALPAKAAKKTSEEADLVGATAGQDGFVEF